MTRFTLLASSLCFSCVACMAALASSPGETILTNGLALGSTGFTRRSAFHRDPVELEIVRGRWHPPSAGDAVDLPNGTNRVWEALATDKNGWSTNRGLGGGYIYYPVVRITPEVAILSASGHSLVYVNGEPRVGDPYANGSVALPVQLQAGTNQFLFQVGREGRLQPKLAAPKASFFIDPRDTTLPDLKAGQKSELWASTLVVNATTNFARGLILVAHCNGSTVRTPLPAIPPLATRKVGFRIKARAPEGTNSVAIRLDLPRFDSATLNLRVRKPHETFKQTFLSDIDGSVQYFAVNPPAEPVSHPGALFLSLHGASVEAIGQADSYAPKNWGWLVSPTNRRPYGFDWEEWGRRDAIEVLDLAQKQFGTTPGHTYLTGHSMGGHGAWQLGVTFPDRFAAIGPSAGWISFWSYGGARRGTNASAVEQMFDRAATPSDTLALSSNYLNQGVYILHGDADDNVPVSEARKMKERLSEFHHDFAIFEQHGAGHWWDASPDAGTDCVDWRPMFDFFARHRIPSNEEIREVQFATANPGISARCYWLTIEQQEHPLQLSAVSVRYDPGTGRFVGTTTNVATLSINLNGLHRPAVLSVQLDGVTNQITNSTERVWFTRVNGSWSSRSRLSDEGKGPNRYGPFKEAFASRMLFVYGTHGSDEENRWALAKARFDAESFWYRGNGSVDVIPDSDWKKIHDAERSVILYGNSQSNSAWRDLLGGSPIQVNEGSVSMGAKQMQSDDLACLFLRPRSGSGHACVAAIGGTGIIGMRLTDRVPYFTAGVAFPDVTIFGPEVLEKGAGAVKCAGFFGNDWSVENGDFAWTE